MLLLRIWRVNLHSHHAITNMSRRSFSFLFPLLFLGFSLVQEASAQSVTYRVTISRKSGLSDKDIMSPLLAQKELKGVQLSADTLLVTVPSAVDYPISRIREFLAASGAMALDYQELSASRAVSAKSSALAVATFMVSGACGMCKERIERAAKSISWVVAANWDEDNHLLTLRYRDTGADLIEVHRAIALVGHDTDRIRAEDAVYNELHHCCQYERLPKK